MSLLKTLLERGRLQKVDLEAADMFTASADN